MNFFRFRRLRAAGPLLALALAFPAVAENSKGFKLSDPSGDDKGPGNYTYPTDAVYKPGSFDITEFEVAPGANQIEFRVTVQVAHRGPLGQPGLGRQRLLGADGLHPHRHRPQEGQRRPGRPARDQRALRRGRGLGQGGHRLAAGRDRG